MKWRPLLLRRKAGPARRVRSPHRLSGYMARLLLATSTGYYGKANAFIRFFSEAVEEKLTSFNNNDNNNNPGGRSEYDNTVVLLCCSVEPFTLCVCVFSSHPFWTSSSLDIPAGVTQEEGHTGFLIHLPSAVRALIFVARRIQPFLSLVDREVEFCVLTN